MFLIKILTHFLFFSNSSGDFRVFLTGLFSKILCHVEASHLTFTENQLNGFSMMPQDYRANLRRQFTFSTKFSEIPGTYLIYHGSMKGLVVLNTGPLDWESSTLTTRSVLMILSKFSF